MVADVTNTLLSLSQGIQNQLAIGEPGLNITSSNIRLSSSVVVSSELSSLSFLPPQTAMEKVQGSVSSSVQLFSDSQTSKIGVSVIQYMTNPKRVEVVDDSAIVSVQVVGNPTPVDAVILLPNYQPVSYNDFVFPNITLNCTWSLDPYNVSVACPMYKNVTFECPGWAGSFEVT